MPEPSFAMPYAVTVEEAVRLFSLSRTEVYGLLSAGTIRGKKYGRKTLVITSSLRDHLDALPDYVPGTGAPASIGRAG